MWKTELYVIVMSAESLTQGNTSVNDSVTPFSVTVKLSAPASAAGALSRSAAAATRNIRERRILWTSFSPGLRVHYPSSDSSIQAISSQHTMVQRLPGKLLRVLIARLLGSEPHARTPLLIGAVRAIESSRQSARGLRSERRPGTGAIPRTQFLTYLGGTRRPARVAHRRLV